MSSKAHPKGTGIHTTDAMRADMCERYRAGEGLIEIARRHGVAPPTVRRALLMNGVTLRPRGYRSPVRQARFERNQDLDVSTVLALRAQDLSIGAIAKRVHRSADWISGVLKEHDKFEKLWHRALTQPQKRQIARRYSKGERAYHLAAEYGVSDKTIARAIREMGGETCGRNGWRDK